MTVCKVLPKKLSRTDGLSMCDMGMDSQKRKYIMHSRDLPLDLGMFSTIYLDFKC